MAALNLTNKPASLDFCTTADVKAFWAPSADDNSMDTAIGDIVSQVSQRFTSILGQHILQAERTEDYELSMRTSAFSLTGANIDSGADFTLYEASRADLLGDATASATTTYTVSNHLGLVRLYERTGHGISYCRVTYTGGLALNTAALETDFPDLHQAAILQVRYLLERRATLGGNIQSSSGAGTTFQGEYTLLHDVRSVLEQYRRRPML